MRNYIFFLLIVSSCPLIAQDVEGFFGEISERLANREILKMNGSAGVNFGLNFFETPDGSAPRRTQPFNWNANAAISLDFLGIKAPFSAAFSNQNTLYSLPAYSFYGISPTYRWITLHAGDRSLNFSPYSLSGINFRGGGIELRPGKFYLAAMNGRLRRARIQDAGSIQDLDSGLKRNGRGLKIGFDNQEGSRAACSVFQSLDRSENLEESGIDSLPGPASESNLVIALSLAHRLNELISVEGEWANSRLTRDDRIAASTTTSANAFNTKIVLSPKFGKIALGYERIAPEYRTHGSLFFQNDLENVTAGIASTMLDKRLTISLNAGVQRNDLDNSSATDNRRFIGSVNLGFTVSERVVSSLALSNFTTTNRYKAIARASLLSDSVVIAQTQQSVDANTSILLDQYGEQTLTVSGAYQRAALIRDEVVVDDQTSRFSMLLLTYARRKRESKSTVSASLVAHRNSTPDLKVTTLGPTAGYNRQVLAERGSLNLSLGYQLALTDLTLPTTSANERSGVVQLTAAGDYRLGKGQRFRLTATLVEVGDTAGRPGFTDVLLRGGWTIGF